GERNLPGIGRCQLTRDKALPQLGLRGIHRLSVTEEEHVTQLDRSSAVVLGQRVLVKLGESGSQTLLYLRGKRLLALAPVERHELGELVSTLDHAKQGLSHKLAMRCQSRHLTHQQQRSVTQLHLFAGLDGQRSYLFRRDLGHQLTDASCDRYTILIELVFPQHAGQNRAPQLLLRRNMLRRRAFVRALALQPGKSAQ